MVGESDADIDRMHEHTARAADTDDWQPLLAVGAHGEGRVAPPPSD